MKVSKHKLFLHLNWVVNNMEVFSELTVETAARIHKLVQEIRDTEEDCGLCNGSGCEADGEVCKPCKGTGLE